jgi:hypothetical protein
MWSLGNLSGILSLNGFINIIMVNTCKGLGLFNVDIFFLIHPIIVLKWHATYCCKALNKGYNFVTYLISIGGLCTKLWAPKIAGDPILGISKLLIGNPETK